MPRTLIRNAKILSLDPVHGTTHGDILIVDGAIERIGNFKEAPGAEIIDADGMIAMPGFVDAHLHTWQTGIRAIAGDWSLGEYFSRVHAGIARFFTPDDIKIANLVGALGQINAGVTTLFDWNHNNPTPAHSDAAIDGLIASGIRAVYGHGTPKPDVDAAGVPLDEYLHPEAEVERIVERLSDQPLVSMALCIRGPDLSSYEASCHDIRLARKHGLISSAHVAGRLPPSRKVPDGMLRLAGDGYLGPDFNSVHSNKLSDEEMAAMVAAGVSFTMTPEVEAQMGHGLPVTGRLLELGVQPSIGIDIETGIGTEMVWAARFALQLQRGLDNAAVIAGGQEVEMLAITGRQALEWITIEGARALGMHQRIGTLVPGKQADIILVRTSDLNMLATADPAEAVLFHSNSANIDTVMIAGTVMKRGGVLLRPDLGTLTQQLADSGRRLLQDSGLARA